MNEKTTFRQKVMQAKGKKGFTLVELVIVIAVLAIIAFIAIPTVSHVIENANTSADASNAQAVETAIKSAQAECAANETTHSDRATTIITDGTKSLGTLLGQYGVSIDVIKTPKVSGDGFWYNSTTGKVTAAVATPGSGYSQLKESSKYTATDNASTPNPVTDGSKAATITIVP